SRRYGLQARGVHEGHRRRQCAVGGANARAHRGSRRTARADGARGAQGAYPSHIDRRSPLGAGLRHHRSDQGRIMAKKKSKGEESWGKLIRDIVVILLLVLGIHSCVAKPFYIPSDSMMPTLRNGDRLIVSKYPYGWSYASMSFHLAPRTEGRLFGKLPERGDIVVLEHPDTRIDYIKRVIGLPGDTIALRSGALFINGKPVKRRVEPALTIPADPNLPGPDSSLFRFVTRDASGREVLELPIVRETLPGGATFDTIDM